MSASNIIDLVDALLSCCCGIAENHRLDLNISIGMVCRIIFFVLTILLRDLNTYTWQELLLQILAWFVFHIFIILFEMSYFLKGDSETDKRELQYKCMDIWQLITGIIYISIEEISTLKLLTLILFALNLFFNIIGLCLSKCQHSKKENYYEKGGAKQISLGLFLGTTTVTVYLFIIKAQYKQQLEASPELNFYLFAVIVGEITAAIFSLCFCCIQIKGYSFTKDCSKGILGILYGVNFGIFSIFYGFLFGLIIIIGLMMIFFSASSPPRVHPQE